MKKILLLEDMDDVAVATEAFIKHFIADIEFVRARSIAEALRVLCEEESQPFNFRLALLDYELPDGFGTELVETFRRRAPACKILVYSALIDAHPEATRLIRRQNPDAMLSKPFTIAELKVVLQKLGLL